jgi:hypothetical protein
MRRNCLQDGLLFFVFGLSGLREIERPEDLTRYGLHPWSETDSLFGLSFVRALRDAGGWGGWLFPGFHPELFSVGPSGTPVFDCNRRFCF